MPFRIRFSLALLLALAGLVLVGPLIVPIRPVDGTVDRRALARPDSHFVRAGGLELHYLEAHDPGTEDATPVIMLHGYGLNALSFRDTLPIVAQLAPAIAFDRPGFGLTERPAAGSWAAGANPYSPSGQAQATLDLMDALDIESAVLIAHSSGVPAALEVALEHPARVSALVLVGSAVYNVGGGSRPDWLLNTPHMRRLGPLFMRQLAGQPGTGLMLGNWSDPRLADERAVEAWQLNFRVNDWDKALWEISRASHDVPFLDRLGQITQPALVVSGAADAIVAPAESERLANELGDATFALMDECGHVPHEECPAQFNELVLTWLLDVGALALP